jgi:hypothetical protein
MAEEKVEEEKGRKILFLTVAGGGGQRASYPTTLYLGEFLTVRVTVINLFLYDGTWKVADLCGVCFL